MKKTIIVLLTIISVLFVAVLYLLYLNLNKVTPVTTSSSTQKTGIIPTEKITPTVISTLDPTADWKTYENSEFGVSFKYPSEYKQTILNGAINLQKNSTRALLYISKFDNPKLLSISQWFEDQPKEDTQSIKNAHIMSETVIDGQKGLMFIKKQPENGYKDFLVIIGNNTNVLYLYFGPLTDEVKTANQILSTVKFTGTTTSALTKNWQTYTNNDFGFTFKYPSTWMDETDYSTSQGREFRLKTDKGEFISAFIFDRLANNSNTQAWSKEMNLKNNKSIKISYTDDYGPGSKGGIIDIDIFDQILSTFKLN